VEKRKAIGGRDQLGKRHFKGRLRFGFPPAYLFTDPTDLMFVFVQQEEESSFYLC